MQLSLLSVLENIRLIVGDSYLLTKPEDKLRFSKDYTSSEIVTPVAVVIPNDVEQISKIVKICNDSEISITVRGGGTGVSGGALAFNNRLIISLERLNKIIEINTIERFVIAEAGVITQDMRDEVLKYGLSFPQNISSSESSFIGGNVAVSSGSPKSLKYGPTKNYLLNMEVVLADGHVMWTGKHVTKNATGYNLTQLFAGSEGSLGIITKIVLQLVVPQQEILMMVSFLEIDRLFNCVYQLFADGYSPSSLEFIDKTGYEITAAYIDKKFQLNINTEGILWIELEGSNSDVLLEEAGRISNLINKFTDEEVYVTQSPVEIRNLWSLRSRLGEAVIQYTSFQDIDLIVPRSAIRSMYTAVKDIAEDCGLNLAIFGHIGNGNFHINLFQENLEQDKWDERKAAAVKQIFSVAVSLGGTISGEHGIGTVQLPYLHLAIPAYQLNLMKEIKQVFDPKNIFGYSLNI